MAADLVTVPPNMAVGAFVADVLVALARRKRALGLHSDAVVGLITLTDAARAVMSDGLAATRR